MVRSHTDGGGETGTMGAPGLALFFALSLSACAEQHAGLATGAPPPQFDMAGNALPVAVPLTNSLPNPDDLQPRGLAGPEAVPMAGVNYLGARLGGSAMARQPGFATAFSPALALAQQGERHHCSFGDRFDRKATLAYNFDANHQLAFKLALNNHGSGGGMEVSHAFLQFHYRFNSVKAPMEPLPREKCHYASHWQGLVGSGYNELFMRETNTIWGEAKDRGLDFWH